MLAFKAAFLSLLVALPSHAQNPFQRRRPYFGAEVWGGKYENKPLPRLTLVAENRLAAANNSTASWCDGTRWPASPETDERRVALVLRGQWFRGEVPEYHEENAPTCNQSLEDNWTRAQFDTAKAIVEHIVQPFEARGYEVEIIGAPSNPDCVHADALYELLGKHRVVRVSREARNQGEGVQNALEALRGRAAKSSYIGYLFWRFDASPRQDAAELIFARGADKLLVELISHTALSEISLVDHAFWLPSPAMACFWSAVMNDPPLEDRCSAHAHDYEDYELHPDEEDEEAGPPRERETCLRVACFAVGGAGGHQCLEALQERIAGWGERVSTFRGEYPLSAYVDKPVIKALTSDDWDKRWWRLTREISGGDSLGAGLSQSVDDFASLAEKEAWKDAAEWREIADNVQAARAAFREQRARRRAARSGGEL